MASRQAVDDCRLYEVPAIERCLRHPSATYENSSTVGLGAFDRRYVCLYSGFIDDWTHPHVAIERIPDLDALRFLDQHLHELVAHILLDVDARARGAFLTLGAERRSHDAIARLIQVSGARDDCRILAPHFYNQRTGDSPGSVVADQLQADLFRAGKHDSVYTVVVDQFLPGR